MVRGVLHRLSAALVGRAVSARRRPFQLTAPVTPEHQAQIDCTDMLARVLRPEVCWTAIDHANAKDATTGAIRKARGVQAGIPDYLFWDYGRGFAIEFKTGDGVLLDSQKEFGKRLINAKVEFAVCWGSRQVFDTVHRWGLTRRLQVAA